MHKALLSTKSLDSIEALAAAKLGYGCLLRAYTYVP